jgi:hypothetical protein
MITGGSTWTTQVNSEQKQPLYVLEIPDVPKYISSFLPSLITSPPSGMLPYLQVPAGAGQSVTETEGQSSLSDLSAQAIDYGGELRSMASDPSLLGKPVLLKLGFPGMAWADFVTIFYGVLLDVGRNADGLMTFTVSDPQKGLVDSIWLNGGPGNLSGTVNSDGSGGITWVSGEKFPLDGSIDSMLITIDSMVYRINSVSSATALTLETSAPSASGVDYSIDSQVPIYNRSFADNGKPITDKNPRYLFGHPLDILLVAMQNDLGVGQDPGLGAPLVNNTQGADGTDKAVYGTNPLWVRYIPGDDLTLINPNAYLDVDGIIALRDGQYIGERMQFVLTRAVTGKSWIDDQILKPLGLYWIAGADGKLRLKPMKHPQTVSPMSVTEDMIVGIPQITRLPIINFVTVRSQVDNSVRETAGRQYKFDQTFVNQTSIGRYNQQYTMDIESDGLRSGVGAGSRSFLTVNRIFNRHAFGTAQYEISSFFLTMVLELGDFILFSHPNLADYWTGDMGLVDVLCEVCDREPDYANGQMRYKVLDTRWFNLPDKAYKVPATSVPVWASASPTQKSTYVFMTDDNGKMSDGTTPGNPIL